MTSLNTSTLGMRKRYKLAREIADLTQEQLAQMIGVARATIGEWEAGRTEPGFSKLAMLAEVTNQPLEFFAEGLIVDNVRPKGLEPLTFWLGAERPAPADPFWTRDRTYTFATLSAEWVVA